MIYFDGQPVLDLDEGGLVLEDGSRLYGINNDLLTDDAGGDEVFESRLNLIRIKRNRLLAQTDWTQILDNALTQTQRTAWQAYRQALRDLPVQINFDNQTYPPWPPLPGEITR